MGDVGGKRKNTLGIELDEIVATAHGHLPRITHCR
jgi:hypothetical protein